MAVIVRTCGSDSLSSCSQRRSELSASSLDGVHRSRSTCAMVMLSLRFDGGSKPKCQHSRGLESEDQRRLELTATCFLPRESWDIRTAPASLARRFLHNDREASSFARL
jgi:hypothetical protein